MLDKDESSSILFLTRKSIAYITEMGDGWAYHITPSDVAGDMGSYVPCLSFSNCESHVIDSRLSDSLLYFPKYVAVE